MLDPALPFANRPVDRLAKAPLLATLAKAWQPVVQGALKAGGPALNSALHGTPFGHAIHPPLTDIPIGAWTVAAILDALELTGGGAPDGADAAIAIGLAGAMGAAATGWAEWSDADGEAKSLGLAHGALNGAAAGAYALGLYLRRTNRRGAGIALSLAGYATVSAAAYLGGELSLGFQLGVKRTAAPLTPPEHFVAVLGAEELADGTMRTVDLQGIPLLLARSGENVSAILAICTHRGGPLGDGTRENGCARCPWHGSRFELRDGTVAEGPAAFPAPHFEARVRGGRIEVRGRA